MWTIYRRYSVYVGVGRIGIRRGWVLSVGMSKQLKLDRRFEELNVESRIENTRSNSTLGGWSYTVYMVVKYSYR